MAWARASAPFEFASSLDMPAGAPAVLLIRHALAHELSISRLVLDQLLWLEPATYV